MDEEKRMIEKELLCIFIKHFVLYGFNKSEKKEIIFLVKSSYIYLWFLLRDINQYQVFYVGGEISLRRRQVLGHDRQTQVHWTWNTLWVRKQDCKGLRQPQLQDSSEMLQPVLQTLRGKPSSNLLVFRFTFPDQCPE